MRTTKKCLGHWIAQSGDEVSASPKEIQYLIKKFRLAVNYYLRDVPTPKPYTVEYQQPSLVSSVMGYPSLDSRIPCPPERRVDVRYLHGFDLFESKHKRERLGP